MQSFLAPNLGGGWTAPTFVRQFVRATDYPLVGKVWLSSVCWSPSAKLGNRSRMQNLRRVGKNGGRVWSRLWTKVHEILRRCRRPPVVVNALTDCLYLVSFRRYRTLKLPLGCEVGPKRWFLGPRFVGGRDIPDFGHAFSNYAYFRPCGRIWFSSVQRPRRLADEKRKKKKKKKLTLVNYKSAYILCRAA